MRCYRQEAPPTGFEEFNLTCELVGQGYLACTRSMASLESWQRSETERQMVKIPVLFSPPSPTITSSKCLLHSCKGSRRLADLAWEEWLGKDKLVQHGARYQEAKFHPYPG